MFKAFRSDLSKYKRYSGKSAIVLILSQQGLWAIIVYRINNAIYSSKLFKPLKIILLLIGLFFQKLMEIITGISLPYSATIGSQFYIGKISGELL